LQQSVLLISDMDNQLTMCTSQKRLWQIGGSIVCLCAILLAFGGHWMMLQSFAWGRMLVENSRHESLGRAIAKTFDGKHPCKLCLAINKAKSGEKRADQQKPAGKIEGVMFNRFPDLRAVAEFPSIIPAHNALKDWSEPPPYPPPRQA
jgi:hypothetical protein